MKMITEKLSKQEMLIVKGGEEYYYCFSSDGSAAWVSLRNGGIEENCSEGQPLPDGSLGVFDLGNHTACGFLQQ